MLLKMSKLTCDDFEKRTYINTSMIAAVGPVAGDPDTTIILTLDRTRTFVKKKKTVEEVVEILKEHDRSLAV